MADDLFGGTFMDEFVPLSVEELNRLLESFQQNGAGLDIMETNTQFRNVVDVENSSERDSTFSMENTPFQNLAGVETSFDGDSTLSMEGTQFLSGVESSFDGDSTLSLEDSHCEIRNDGAIFFNGVSVPPLENSNLQQVTDCGYPIKEEPLPMKSAGSPDSDISVAQTSTDSTMMRYITSTIPGSEDWTGDFDFKVGFGNQEKNTKSAPWMYSAMHDKLYVKKDVPCPVNFSVNARMPDDCYIRVMPLFLMPQCSSQIVQSCLNCAASECKRDISGIPNARHLVRCESPMSSYQVDQNAKHHSVVVPFENPPAGQPFSTYIFKFACLSSHLKGLNKNPLMLVFSLERGGQVIGRRRVNLKVCASPGRDLPYDEKRVAGSKKKIQGNLSCPAEFAKSSDVPSAKKLKKASNPERSYVIQANSQEQYDFLKQMVTFHKISEKFKSVKSFTKKCLLHYPLKSSSDSSS